MRGRNAVDPELARVVEQRLERLLAERAPRRAQETEDESTPLGVRDQDDSSVDVLEAPVRRGGRRLSNEGRSEGRRPGRDAAGEESDEPDPERGRESGKWPGFTRLHLAVVGVLVLLGLLLGGWAVLRAKPVPLPVVAVSGPGPGQDDPAASGAASPVAPGATARASPGPSGPAASPAVRLVVHVVGAVRRPGLVELTAGARVQDAIAAAGGLRSGARLGDLNLAQPLADGQQLVVGKDAGGRSEVRGGTSPPTTDAGSTGSSGSTGGPLDLNAATATQLDLLPGVGPVTAAKIISWREEHGRFNRVEELQEVSGIGPKTYAEIAPHCRV